MRETEKNKRQYYWDTMKKDINGTSLGRDIKGTIPCKSLGEEKKSNMKEETKIKIW